MLYVSQEKNQIIFNNEDYNEKDNYLPLLVDAFSKLDPKKALEVLIDLDRSPVVFILYSSKIIKEAGARIKLYHLEDSEELRLGLESEGFEYNNIKDWK